jgi:L-lactate dehydrogenase (cytochrome)
MTAPVDPISMHKAARRRVPRFAYDFIAGGAGEEQALRRSQSRLRDICLLPRVLTGCSDRSTSCDFLGVTYAAPFGVAPTGLTNLVWPGTDERLAMEAERLGIPYVISTPATTSLERLAALAPRSAWFQLYMGQDERMGMDLLDRAKACGVSTLVVTADVPVPGHRRRDIRNDFRLPLRLSLTRIIDLLTHPAWTAATLRAGLPRFANLERYAGSQRGAQSLARLMASQTSAKFDWPAFRAIRARWKGPLILKGVLHPGDAQMAADAGADGIVVSNHGGRQLDSAPAPIDMVAPIAAAVSGRLAIMLDGGIETGEDIARALAAGADFVLIGRALLWAVAALGPVNGARMGIEALQQELLLAMGQLGCRIVADIAGIAVQRQSPPAAYLNGESCHV